MAQEAKNTLFHHSSEDNSDDSTEDDPSFPRNLKDYQKYNMEYASRGLALIIAHSTFQVSGYEGELSDRSCCQQDIDLSERCFKGLGFGVIVLKDKKLREIRQILNDVSRDNHADRGCLAIIVSTHGTSDNFLYASDSAYHLDELFKPFRAENCSTLAGKPKLYFIQACRGERAQLGMCLSLTEATSSTQNSSTGKMFLEATYEDPAVGDSFYNEDEDEDYLIDIEDDFLVCFSTIPGHVSFQRPSGSWFIKSLCKRLNKRTERHLLHILTFVNWEIAVCYESNSRELKYAGKKQMSLVTSKLQKFLIFPR